MFSCALFCTGSDVPLPAKTSEVSVKVIGTVGQGTAVCSYSIDRDMDGLLLYVPSLLSLHSVTRQHIRLSSCEVSVGQSSGENTVTHALKLQIDDSDLLNNASPVCSGRGDEVPEYNELRRRYKASVSNLCGSHSYEDVLLYVGDLPRGSQLSVCFEFLTRFSSSNQCPPIEYILHQSLPSLHLSYNLLLASLCPVADVTTTGSLGSFSWEYIYEEAQHRNLVQVSYTTSCNDVWSKCEQTDALPGVRVLLEGEMSAGCCCSLPAPITEREQNSLLAPHDGVMMLSSVFTPHLLPKSLKPQLYSPSEFVFVVDCSGSMSGTNIQTAADTLITCIKSLPLGSYFNVVAFGSTFRKLFHNSEAYSESTMESAVQFANQIQASLGGTELLGPLHWIFKSQRSPGLSCQVFIITDGGVTNTTSVLRCVRRNRHQARCHTFGIGGEVCRELVTGIAAASGGQCVLLSPGQRLQTKVMEVLKDSMQPSMSNVLLQWHPPKGYTVVDSSPRNVGTLYSGNSYSAFAFLRKSDPTINGTHNHHGDDVITPMGTATLTGLVNGEQVDVNVTPVTLPSLTGIQSSEITSLLSRSAVWSKIGDLELQALCNSRKNSHNEGNDDEPLAKKPRLNGSLHTTPSTSTPLQENSLRDELTELSVRSGILCPLTYLQSESGTIRQIIPLPHSSLSKPNKPTQPTPAASVVTRVSPSIRYRKRMHNSSNHHHSSEANVGFSLTSLAKNTFSAIGSTFKTMANITTFGLVGQEVAPVIENGQSLDDEIEYQEKRHSQLHWDETRGNIVYPDIYYRSHPGNTRHRHNGATTVHIRSKRSHRHSSHNSKNNTRHYHHHKRLSSSSIQPPATALIQAIISTTQPTPLDHHHLMLEPTVVTVDNHSAEEDDDLAISDTESDSSVDPDWEDLHKPNELLPLIHTQLFSGAWPLVRAFSYAVGVPLEEIRKLPLCYDESLSNNAQNQMNGCATSGQNNAHLWATALAVACLKEHFSELQNEWEVVAYKGHSWIEQQIKNTSLTLDQVHNTAHKLVQRRS